jgi:gas vesicle protein
MGYDQSMTDSKSSNHMGVVLLAAAAGAVAGMLFAPKKGTETREDLMNKYNGAKTKTRDSALDAKERVNRGVEAARSKVHDAADNTKDAADKAADKTKDATAKTAPETSLAEEIQAERAKRGGRPAM